MRILSSKQFNCNLKATIQKTGKLGFNEETGRALSLGTKTGVKFFMEGEPEQLYMAITAQPDEDAFALKKNGGYFHVAAQLLFDELGVDYRTYTVIYDLVRCRAFDEEAGGECYRMNKRTIKKKSKDEDIDK